jgi:hypothetical protein
MSFIRVGSRLGNGSRSGAYVYNDGEFINLVIAHKSAARRNCQTWARITCEELIALAKATVNLGWSAPGEFLSQGTRLANGAKSGVVSRGDGHLVSLTVAPLSAKRRKSDTDVKLTYAELKAIARSCVNRGWVKAPEERVDDAGAAKLALMAASA